MFCDAASLSSRTVITLSLRLDPHFPLTHLSFCFTFFYVGLSVTLEDKDALLDALNDILAASQADAKLIEKVRS